MNNEKINPEHVRLRLKRCGVDISNADDVVVALETEIRHYRLKINAMQKPPDDARPKPKSRYDFEQCLGVVELANTLQEINEFGCRLITVTQDGGIYTVFFEGNTYA